VTSVQKNFKFTEQRELRARQSLSVASTCLFYTEDHIMFFTKSRSQLIITNLLGVWLARLINGAICSLLGLAMIKWTRCTHIVCYHWSPVSQPLKRPSGPLDMLDWNSWAKRWFVICINVCIQCRINHVADVANATGVVGNWQNGYIPDRTGSDRTVPARSGPFRPQNY